MASVDESALAPQEVQHGAFTPEKSPRGWLLRSPDRDVVVDAEGFTRFFTSRSLALAATVTRDEENDWWVCA